MEETDRITDHAYEPGRFYGSDIWWLPACKHCGMRDWDHEERNIPVPEPLPPYDGPPLII
jgi:helix-turn-helix protein